MSAAGTTRGHVEFINNSVQNAEPTHLIQAFILSCITGYLPNDVVN